MSEIVIYLQNFEKSLKFDIEEIWEADSVSVLWKTALPQATSECIPWLRGESSEDPPITKKWKYKYLYLKKYISQIGKQVCKCG